MLLAVEAVIDVAGNVKLLPPISAQGAHRSLFWKSQPTRLPRLRS